MGPSTCGAMPMRLAKISASSVRGWRAARHATARVSRTAPATMLRLSQRSMGRCDVFPKSKPVMLSSGKSEKDQPNGESQDRRQAWIDQHRKHEIDMNSQQQPVSCDCEEDAESYAPEPCGEK